MKDSLIPEIQYELSSTRRILERLPESSWTWKPHEKSRSLGQLAAHIAGIPGVFIGGLGEPEFDRLTHPSPALATLADILAQWEDGGTKALDVVGRMSDEELQKSWRYRYGEKIIFEMPRIAILRGMGLNHLIHHRGQLTVYFRLLNVPVPGMYGPSADE